MLFYMSKYCQAIDRLDAPLFKPLGRFMRLNTYHNTHLSVPIQYRNHQKTINIKKCCKT